MYNSTTSRTYVGLDVHKDTIAVAVLRPGNEGADQQTVSNRPEAVRRLVSSWNDPGSFQVCYEAGPTGYELQRHLASLGVSCQVVAPALVPRRPGVRIKTDRRDALNLAGLYRAGELTPIRIPSPEEEAIRERHGIPVFAIASLDDLLAFLESADSTDAGLATHRDRVAAYRARYGVAADGPLASA